MFGFFKKKQAASPTKRVGDPVIAALLLDGDSFPAESFLTQAAAKRIAGKAVSRINSGSEGIFSFEVEDELFALAHMPVPYPAGDLAGPIATTWLWPPQPHIEQVKQHRSHLLITATGGQADPVRRRLAMTAVTALAAQQPGAQAVYWAEAALIIFPRLFIEMAESIDSPTAPPLYLWVDLRAFRNQDGTTSLFTTGLAPLGHREMEIHRIDMDPGELREWLLNIMYYLLEKGPVLKHGETIGISADHKIRIRHGPSSFGHSGTVICLEP